MFNRYEKDGKIIFATPRGYDVIYKSQGFKPYTLRGDEVEGNKNIAVGRGNAKNNGVDSKPSKRRKSAE